MRTLSRVVWSEGMHLAQHHFQLQNTYFEHLTGAALDCLSAAPHGVIDLQLDGEALLNGYASLVAGRGIMPDGLPFSFPDQAPPPSLGVADLFSPTQTSHLLLLGLPHFVPGKANCGDPTADSKGLRFSAVQQLVADETTGTDERAIYLVRGNFRLFLESEPTEGMVTMPIARIRRDGTGHFVYDPEFIGPCLRIAASPSLMEIVSRTITVLESRADSLRSAQAGVSSHSPRDVAGFWLRHAFYSATPGLRHAHRTGNAHPEHVYVHLAQVAGALCTFSMDSHPRELPVYDHDAPQACFQALERHINKHLDVILPTETIALQVVPLQDLEREQAGAPAATSAGPPKWFWGANVTDPRCLSPSARWYLGISSSAPGAQLVNQVPRVVKVCAAMHIEAVVQKGLPSMTLEHVSIPPAELAPRIGMHYFEVRRLESDPRFWKAIVDTGQVGLYVPGSIPGPELELKVIPG